MAEPRRPAPAFERAITGALGNADREIDLTGKPHHSISGHHRFNLSRSHRRAPIARDWTTRRKRWTAAVSCLSTAFTGLVIGIYAGEVPGLQYAIADEAHYAILGNVLFFIGLAIPTFFCYSLPLLHGRKPYIVAALALFMPLQFPPALITVQQRDPDNPLWRTGLLFTRALSGLAMGFANINFFGILLDLFGSSLMSGNPHQEVVIAHDPRRHGGGLGLWLGIWTWCFLASLGVGFLIGACIINALNVSWGFWIMIFCNVFTLVVNVLAPETRRSAFRRSMAEANTSDGTSRRVGRGEIRMHMYSTGPVYWWEEVTASISLNISMLSQPGFLILSLYQGWIYGQIVIVIILLGALASREYFLTAQYVGLCVTSIPLGALLAVPFQKASFFSRARHHGQRTDSMTFEKRLDWTSHLLRRTIFMILLPFAGMAYTVSSSGQPTSISVPCLFAAVIGFLSNLALSECIGLIMETFDTSDLQPGMTGRRRDTAAVSKEDQEKRKNYSCFPRVLSGVMIGQTLGFLIGSAATGWGGSIVRTLGAQQATGIMAGVLFFLTLLLVCALTRFKTVKVVPDNRAKTGILAGPDRAGEWLPVVIGSPSGTTRRISLLELGRLTRWSEIRRKNRLLEGSAFDPPTRTRLTGD
ncbi:MAG: hypothetical protein GOMPHAMPRED_001937 [Gomphillus americanus]|uniref:MFS general substrate transporter n=1 Tax=Gomphillus americanus TaxID=1940652 RepID=A0A8H3F878_9LECA|nr:MAG: hypothetical protein GOMPHAMPRED_001937 [Gomphillus americanus]